MLAIQDNPYRTIGVLAGANQREIEKQKAKINAFLRVGKEILFDTDFGFLVLPKRNEESINTAFSNIQLNQGRVLNGLFWFVKGSHLDEPAFSYLKGGDTAKAIEIWTKTTSSGKVTIGNFSSFNNLGTIKLALAFSNGDFDRDSLAEGINYKLKLIESEGFQDFVQKVADKTFVPDSEKQAKHFIDEVLVQLNPHIDTLNGISKTDLLALFLGANPESHQYLVKKFTEKPLQNIEDKISRTKRKRSDDSEGASVAGVNLFRETQEELADLKLLFGVSNVQYRSLADKLANELLQCGIDYFQEFRDSNSTDPGSAAMLLFRKARSVAEGSQTKARIKENTEGLQEWIDDKPEREKQARVAGDIQYITLKLDQFQNKYNSIDNARAFVVDCKPRVKNIKTEFGAYDEFYLKISTTVVNNAMGMLVDIVNTKQATLSPGSLLTTINDVVDLMNSLAALDMVPKARTSFNKNKETVVGIQSQLKSIANGSYSSSSSPSKTYDSDDNSGCIWTVVIVAIIALLIGMMS